MNKQKEIAILDYITGTVYIRPVPIEMINNDIEDIVVYFEPLLNIHANDCHYMMAKEIDIKQ